MDLSHYPKLDGVSLVEFDRALRDGAKFDAMYDFAAFRVYASGSAVVVEEKPAKGKRMVGSAHVDTYWHAHVAYNSGFLGCNLVMGMGLLKVDSFEAAVGKLKAALASVPNPSGVESPRVWVENLNALLVEPDGCGPVSVEGKDFAFTASWASFKAYSPSSDFESADPHYTYYAAKSPTAARKLYKLVKADPTALADVPWGRFSEWLREKGVHYETHFSVWR